jgi:hypothetical protein
MAVHQPAPVQAGRDGRCPRVTVEDPWWLPVLARNWHGRWRPIVRENQGSRDAGPHVVPLPSAAAPARWATRPGSATAARN